MGAGREPHFSIKSVLLVRRAEREKNGADLGEVVRQIRIGDKSWRDRADSAAGRQYSTSGRRQSLGASNPPEAVSSSSSTIVARIEEACGMHVLTRSPYQVSSVSGLVFGLGSIARSCSGKSRPHR
jgi:hypothetical protein